MSLFASFAVEPPVFFVVREGREAEVFPTPRAAFFADAVACPRADLNGGEDGKLAAPFSSESASRAARDLELAVEPGWTLVRDAVTGSSLGGISKAVNVGGAGRRKADSPTSLVSCERRDREALVVV